jgi:hypothetical protein
MSYKKTAAGGIWGSAKQKAAVQRAAEASAAKRRKNAQHENVNESGAYEPDAKVGSGEHMSDFQWEITQKLGYKADSPQGASFSAGFHGRAVPGEVDEQALEEGRKARAKYDDLLRRHKADHAFRSVASKAVGAQPKKA